MDDMRHIVFGCRICSTCFAPPDTFITDCVDDYQPFENIRLFSRAGNVYWNGRKENRIDYIVSDLEDKKWRADMTMTNVYCSGCRNHCGWKIVSVGPNHVLHPGQYLLDAVTIHESQARAFP